MANSDVVGRERPIDLRLDGALAAIFHVTPSPQVVASIDDRIRPAIATWSPPSRQRRIPRVAAIVFVGAAIALGGATGTLQSLYAVIGGFDVPWHRGQEIGASETVDGYTVTIDRAYADATRLALAISVVDDQQRPGTTQVQAFTTIVTDASGEYGSAGGAVSRPDGPFAAVNVAWKEPPLVPLPSGPRALHVVVPFIQVRDDQAPPENADQIGWSPWRQVAGPWTFDIVVDVDGGTEISAAAEAQIDGVRITIPRLIVASSVVRVEMEIDGVPPGDWTPVGEVRRGGRTLGLSFISQTDEGSLVIQTDGGVSDASGEWIVEVRHLSSGDDTPDLPGPWILTFSVP